MKGDVRSQYWLVEAKQAKGQRYTLDYKILRKIEVEALHASKEPALVVEMAGRTYVVLTYDAWLSVAGAMHKLDY